MMLSFISYSTEKECYNRNLFPTEIKERVHADVITYDGLKKFIAADLSKVIRKEVIFRICLWFVAFTRLLSS
ncbi:hypothetical protein MF1_02560 [Bartonella quintana]|nr:hypothetical protein MF1_02560 [Bartonella quintana]